MNNYTKKLTEYSKGNVSYNPATSQILVKNKPWFKVTKTESKSANERGYLIAGKLARIFHDCSAIEAATVVDGNVMSGSYEVVTPSGNDAASEELAKTFNNIMGLSN